MNENNDNKQNELPKSDIKSAIETKSTSFRDKLAMFKQKAEKPTNPPPFKRASLTKPIETSLQKNVEKINEEPSKENNSIEVSTNVEEKINEKQPKEQFRPIEVSSKITMALQKNEEQPPKDKFRPIEVSTRITMALQKNEEKNNEDKPAKENISRIDIPRKSQNFSALQESIKLRFTQSMGGDSLKPFGFKKEEPKPTVAPIKEEPIKQEETPKVEKNNVKEVIKEPPKPIEMKNGIPVPPDIKNMNKKEKDFSPIERAQTFTPSIKNESLPTSHISGSSQEESLSSIRTAASINTSGVTTNIPQPPQAVNNESFLSAVEIPENVINDSFCEGFFISSFPANNGKVVENSDDYEATCGHKVCSSLPAMQPEIIYRYPQKDTKSLELNNLAASICFPSGIKICYEEENPIETVKNYSSSITNQQGDRYYMVTYHFFYKILNGQFVTKYSMYPIKSQTMKFCNDFYETIENDNELQEQISKKLEEYGELNFREVVYVPFCISLISKYPYFNQMEKCLESIRIMISNYNAKTKEINDLIHYIVKSIPIPPVNTKLRFPLPFTPEFIDIMSPYYQDMCLLGSDITCLINLFTIENIIFIFRLMIFEQKILFVDNEYDRLSEVTNSFISILYPFQ